MTKEFFILAHDEARRRAREACLNAPEGTKVRFSPGGRTLPQNDLIHPVVRRIQKYMQSKGAKKRSEEWWRYYLLGKFAGSEVCEDPDGSGGIVVMNREAGTSGMNKERASEFIEWMYAFGSDIGIDWNERNSA